MGGKVEIECSWLVQEGQHQKEGGDCGEGLHGEISFTFILIIDQCTWIILVKKSDQI